VPLGRGIVNLILALGRALVTPGLWVSLAVVMVAVWAGTAYWGSLMPVTVIEDDAARQVRTRCAIVGELLQDIGVVVGEQDYLDPDSRTLIQPGMAVDVRHARLATISADGTTRDVYVHSQDADEMLKEAGVELGPGDQVRLNGQLRTGVESAGTELATASSRAAALFPASSRGERLPESLSSVSRIDVERAATLYLHDGSAEQVLRTTARTVGEALTQAKTLLYVGDHVSPDIEAPLSAGMHIHIERAALVSVLVDGRTLRARTQYRTAAGVLGQLGVSLVGNDEVQPSLDSPVRDGMRIQVVRVSERTFVEQQEIPFETQWTGDPSLELDSSRLDDAGAVGITRRRYKATYWDGREADRVLDDEWVAQEPRPRKVAYGTRIVIRTLETADGPVEYWRRIRVFFTSYTAATCGKTPDDPEYGITRLGWKMQHGIVAVDPQVIRLRSAVYVPGYGKGVAGDTGGLIKGRHVDLGYDEGKVTWHYEWGYVYLLTPVPSPSQIPWILPDSPRER
jgi:resuscitation-promoting factor RpfB